MDVITNSDGMDAAALEQVLSLLLEELLWVEAHRQNLGTPPSEPRQSDDPITVAEYVALRKARDAYRDAYTAHMEQKNELNERFNGAAHSLYNIISATWVLIPAFGTTYSVWIANVGHGADHYNVVLRLAETQTPIAESAAD